MIHKAYHHALALWRDSLYRNSFWLMAGSFSMAGIGFFYWLIASRLYTPTQIGLAATFLSSASLVNALATLGFNTTLLRYLPSAKNKKAYINTAFTVILLAAFVFGLIFLIGLPIWAAKLLFFQDSALIFLGLLLFFPLSTLNAFTDNVFTASRESHWVFASNILQSLVKTAGLVGLAVFGIWGIIGSQISGVIIAVIFCLILIALRYQTIFKPTLDLTVLNKVKKYAIGNYLSGMVGSLPALLLPLIITAKVSPEQTAYFYMPNMLVSLLAIIPSTISRSYLTESSHEKSIINLKKPLILTFSIVLPISLIFLFFGQTILTIFGKNYSDNGYLYLMLTTAATLISVGNYFLGTKLLLQHRLKKMIFITTSSAITYLLGSWVLTSLGIQGIGIAAILSQLLSFLLLLI